MIVALGVSARGTYKKVPRSYKARRTYKISAPSFLHMLSIAYFGRSAFRVATRSIGPAYAGKLVNAFS